MNGKLLSNHDLAVTMNMDEYTTIMAGLTIAAAAAEEGGVAFTELQRAGRELCKAAGDQDGFDTGLKNLILDRRLRGAGRG